VPEHEQDQAAPAVMEQILERLERIEARLPPQPRAEDWSAAREILRQQRGPAPTMTAEQSAAYWGPAEDPAYIEAATRHGPSSPAAAEALARARVKYRKRDGESVQQRYDRQRAEDGGNRVHSAETLTRIPQGAPMVMSAPGDAFRAPPGAWNQAPPSGRPWTQAEMSAWQQVPQPAPMPLPPNALPPADVHPGPRGGLQPKGSADE